MATKEEVAWAAGLFEGEGTWIVRKGGTPQAALGMRDRDVVDRFAAIVDCGSVARVERETRNPLHSDMWYWQLSNAHGVLRLVEMLYPYLGERRRAKADEVRAAAKLVGSRGRSKYQTHCMRGHAFDEENTGHRTYQASNGRTYTTRYCKQCIRERSKRRKS